VVFYLQLFTGKSLRELLIDAVRYNADPEVKEQLERIIRATAIGKFGPRLKLHGHEFRYYKEKQ